MLPGNRFQRCTEYKLCLDDQRSDTYCCELQVRCTMRTFPIDIDTLLQLATTHASRSAHYSIKLFTQKYCFHLKTISFRQIFFSHTFILACATIGFLQQEAAPLNSHDRILLSIQIKLTSSFGHRVYAKRFGPPSSRRQVPNSLCSRSLAWHYGSLAAYAAE